MVRFGLGNYEDYLFKAIVGSSFAKNGLMTAATYIITAIVRFHFSIIVCMLINGTFFTNIIFPVIVSVLLSFASNNLYRYIETHRFQYEKAVDYFIANYSWDNLMMWKRYLLLGMIGYILLALTFITIDNYFVFITAMQAAASFIICDLLENRTTIVRRIKTWWFQPSVTFIESEFTTIKRNHPKINTFSSTQLSTNKIESPTPLRRLSVSEINLTNSMERNEIDIYREISPSPIKPSTPPLIENGLISISLRPPTPPSIQQRIGSVSERHPTPPSIQSMRQDSQQLINWTGGNFSSDDQSFIEDFHSFHQEIIPIPQRPDCPWPKETSPLLVKHPSPVSSDSVPNILLVPEFETSCDSDDEKAKLILGALEENMTLIPESIDNKPKSD